MPTTASEETSPSGSDEAAAMETSPTQPEGTPPSSSSNKTTKASKKKNKEPPRLPPQQQQQPVSRTSTPGPGLQDQHPYARGSSIEVWHIPKTDETDGDWWSEASSSDEEGHDTVKTIRLVDIIDRAPVETVSSSSMDASNNSSSSKQQQWRYYVHYRDFNRRMDEWIRQDRIVSPPSVGNAKARALKKEEERQKKLQLLRKQEEQEKAKQQQQQQLLQEQQQQQAPDAAAAGATRGSSRRRASAVPAEGDEGARRTRLSRRKSSVLTASDKDSDDLAAAAAAAALADEETVVAENQSSAADKVKKEKGVVTTDTVTTHQVGEHVVATVQAQELDEHEGLDEASLREHEEVTKVKNVDFLEMGQYQMETWYFSPLPKELLSASGFCPVLYVCEFTFTMFCRKSELQRFQARLPVQDRHPPGNEIYRKGHLAMFEVDGLEEKIYCQNLCYIAKLFLDHKTLYFDVDPFLFYVLCEVDNRGFHPVGYYSKEKYSDVGYNLACILTFPAHQRKGYGRFLIAFSYELSKKEEKVGSPEKPMSDLGQQAYKPYWASTVVDYLLNQSDESSLSIMDISKKTSIMAEDIVFTLNQLGILKIINGVYLIAAEQSLLERLAKKYPVKEPRVDPSKLHWTPFLTDVKRDKFSIHSKKPSVEAEESRSSGGFP